DWVAYTDDWFTTSAAAGGGVSLELVNPYSACVASVGWLQSENIAGGTPGMENSVFNIAPDIVAPLLTGASVSTSGSEVTIIFSEPIDTSLSQINPFVPAGNFVSAIQWSGAFTSAVVTLFQPLTAPASLQIFIQGLSDCSGNIVADTSVTIQLGLIPLAGDIVINEILADPSPVIGLPNAEFFELRNNTSSPLDLSNLKVNGYPILGASIISANGFMVVTDDGNISLFSGVSIAYITSLSLTNTTDDIVLTNANDDILDQVVYTDDWYNDAVKDDGGWSLERIKPNTSCSGRNDWSASMSEMGGTPGQENSIFSNAASEPPLIVASGVADSSSIYIVFNQSMDTTSGWQPPILLPSGYLITDKYWTSDLDKVILRFAEEFTPATPISLNVSAYMNCQGMMVDTSLLYFTLGFNPQAGDFIINEIMADASGTNQTAFPGADFIELYNRSGHLLELTEITINGDGFNEQVRLEADSFIVIADVSDAAEFVGISSFVAMEDFPSLYENGILIEIAYRG
ncbi:MAG: lamin tail domain-containing protein, partial [Flavobacteriales bacterium]